MEIILKHIELKNQIKKTIKTEKLDTQEINMIKDIIKKNDF